MLLAPKAFAIVEPQLFRSAVFSREHFSFVRQLKLRTIMYLSSEEAPRDLTDFCNEEEVRFLNLGIHQPYGTGEWSPLHGDLAKTAIETLLDNGNIPLLIVCLDGTQQTGALVGCLRKLQGWSFTSIVEEHRRFCEVSARSPVEHFIERFDVDIITPPTTLPEWFEDDMIAFNTEKQQIRESRQQQQ